MPDEHSTAESPKIPPASLAACLAPLVVYLAFGAVAPPAIEKSAENEPAAAAESEISGEDELWSMWTFPAGSYPWFYGLQILATVAAAAPFWRTYLAIGGGVNWLAPVVGVVGVIIWIGLCHLHLEEQLLTPLGVGSIVDLGRRPGFDPFAALGESPLALFGFLAVRFLGLALVVPFAEEMLLRGCVVRLAASGDGHWEQVPVGVGSPPAYLTAIVYGALTHPAEMFAAVVWFALVTWLVSRTKSLWDAVVAHAVTNLLLGVYVLATHNYWLW